MESFILELREAIASDITKLISNEVETGVYGYVLPCNPKSYPISGLQHFFGTAFIAARLAEFSGMDECEQAVAFLAGLLHDYEKMGLDFSILENRVDEVLGESTQLYEVLDRHICGRYCDAIEVASKLEGGSSPRKLQVIAEFVRLGDYTTGGEESWNIAYVMDSIRSTLDRIGIKHYLVPVVIGRQRPVIAMVAEKLEEELESLGIIPLVSTPTGLLALSRDLLENALVSRLYDALTQYIVKVPTVSTGTSPERKIKKSSINLDIIRDILDTSTKLVQIRNEKERRSLRSRLSNQLGRINTLHKLSVSDLVTSEMEAQTPEDKRRLAIYILISLARTLHGVANERTLKTVLDDIGVKVTEDNAEEILLKLYGSLGELEEQLNRVLSVSLDIAKKHISEMAGGKEVEESVSRVLRRTISIGFTSPTPEVKGEIACSRCRERVGSEVASSLYEQLQVEQRAIRVTYADVFHPDKQGKPDSASSMDGSAKKLFVCPVCFFESKVFTEMTGFMDGMWASNIVYYPAVSTDLLRLVKDVSSEYFVVGPRSREKKRKPLVIPDYISSRIIVKTSDEQGRLRKLELLKALDLWYYIGGSLTLTTNALSVSPPWSGAPIEMEASDVIIEESIAKFMEELKIAKERYEWTRTRMLRKILYEQLKTYVQSLEEAEIELGRSRFLKSGLVVSNAPALDVYSFVGRRKQ